MIDFKFSSAIEKIAELGEYSEFSHSEAIVLDFAHTLLTRFPRPKPFYVLHLNNFFTTRKLYQELYELGIGANETAKAGSGIPKELAYLRDAMTKQNDHGEWFNWVVGSVNCIAFCDSASNAMMTTVHDPTVEEYTYFEAVKRSNASLKYAKFADSLSSANSASSSNSTLPEPSANSTHSLNSTLPAPSANPSNSTLSAPSTNSASPSNTSDARKPFLRKLCPLNHYNKEMGGSDNHAKLNSFFSTGRHHHRRNWFPLLYFIFDAAITNAYILYKLSNQDNKRKILSHAEFQEEIARELLRNPRAILRHRPPRHPKKSCKTPTKSVRKEASEGHAWVESDKYRRCQVCHPPQKRGPKKRERNALEELSVNALNSAKDPRSSIRRTQWSCVSCDIPICHDSRCWDRHEWNIVLE
jgi:hypothetical protein